MPASAKTSGKIIETIATWKQTEETPVNDLLTFILAMAPTPSDAGQAGPPVWTSMVFMGVLFVMFYVILVHPQLKAKKDHEKLLSALKTGDRVAMSSGILGTVTNIRDKEIVVVKIADNVKIDVQKSSITSILKDEAKEESKT